MSASRLAPPKAERRAFSIADVFKSKTPGSPVVSADGADIVFTLSEPDVEANSGSSSVWVVATSGGGEPRLLLKGPASDPKFSPDGRRLSFLRGGQVWAVSLTYTSAGSLVGSGEPAQISSLEGGLGGAMWADNSYQWSPDSSYIAVVARGVPGRGYDTTAATDDANVDMFVAERAFYKWNAGWYSFFHHFIVKTPCFSGLFLMKNT